MTEQLKAFVLLTIRNLVGMFQENKLSSEPQLSIGRVSFSILFGLCCIFWMWKKIDPPDTMMTTLYALLAYVTSTKITDIFRPKA